MLYTVTRTITPANAATDAAYPFLHVGRPTWLFAAYVSVPTAFDGTTPSFDLFADLAKTGLYDANGAVVDLTADDQPQAATGLVDTFMSSLGIVQASTCNYFAPGIVYGVVSQDGTPGGGLTGSTVGLASVQLVLAAV